MEQSEKIEVETTDDGVVVHGPKGIVATLTDDEAVALGKRILHLVAGTARIDEPTYQKSLG